MWKETRELDETTMKDGNEFKDVKLYIVRVCENNLMLST